MVHRVFQMAWAYFGPDILARDISAWTFHHGDFSAQGHFGTIEILAHGLGRFGIRILWQETFRHGHFIIGTFCAQGHFGTMDVMALEHFGIRIFWH